VNGLLFRLGAIGDTVVSLPAFEALRHAFPHTTWHLLTDAGSASSPTGVAAILGELGLIEGVVTLPRNATPGAVFASLRSVRRLRPGVVAYLPPRERTTRQILRDRAFFAAAGCGRVIGPWRCRLDVGALPRPLSDVGTDVAELQRVVAEHLGPPQNFAVSPPFVQAADAVRDRMRAWLASRLPHRPPVLVGFGVGSKAPAKVWPIERFIEVAQRLHERFGAVPIVFGGPDDAALARRLLDAVGSGVDASGQLSIGESLALLPETSLFISNDSGPMHLSYASGVYTIGIFAAQDVPGRWSPPSGLGVALRVTIECEGCRLTRCPRGNACLDAIAAQAVIVEASRVLSSREGSARR
jgi:heptosyltransferase-3